MTEKDYALYNRTDIRRTSDRVNGQFTLHLKNFTALVADQIIETGALGERGDVSVDSFGRAALRALAIRNVHLFFRLHQKQYDPYILNNLKLAELCASCICSGEPNPNAKGSGIRDLTRDMKGLWPYEGLSVQRVGNNVTLWAPDDVSERYALRNV